MEERKTVQQEHKLNMENREKLFLTGVEDVDSFDENEIKVYTSMGMLTVRGVELHINKLSTDSGELCIEGDIDSLIYTETSEQHGSFFSRIFR